MSSRELHRTCRIVQYIGYDPIRNRITQSGQTYHIMWLQPSVSWATALQL
jgi:hypothetical protein